MTEITFVVVSFFFLPSFLKSRIYTIPEFFGYRYNSSTGSNMSLYILFIYLGVGSPCLWLSKSVVFF
jgi:uncharacterized sodium:solute symporter family permease YidK